MCMSRQYGFNRFSFKYMYFLPWNNMLISMCFEMSSISYVLGFDEYMIDPSWKSQLLLLPLDLYQSVS